MAKKVALLTSGGDCAGLNAAIRSVVLRAHFLGMSVVGIRHGTVGLAKRPVDAYSLTPETLDPSLLRQGGTMLGTTTRGNPFSFPNNKGEDVKDCSKNFIEGLQSLGCDALIGIGGDGSHAILQRLCQKARMPYVAIPKTIDNDVPLTEKALGFSTAVDVATEAMDRLMSTAASHDRVMVLEVMGRDAGFIALSAGLAGGADVILIPEIPYSLEGVAQKIRGSLDKGHGFGLCVVAEAVKTGDHKSLERVYTHGERRYGGIAHYLSDEISALTGAETRHMVLGHVQRGCPPSATDRLMAANFGVHAVDLVQKEAYGRMVAWQGGKVTDVAIEDVLNQQQKIHPQDPFVQTALKMGIYMGDIDDAA